MTFHGTPKWAHTDHGHGHDDHVHDDHASHAQIESHSEPLEDDAHGHGHDDHGHGHGHTPHESPWVVVIPLLLLAVGAVFAGGVFAEKFIGAERLEFWRAAIFTLPSNTVLGEHDLPWQVLWAPLTVTIIGFAAAWYAYILHEGMGARIAAKKGPLWSFLYNKWYFDEAYELIFVRGAKALGRPVLEGRRSEDHRRPRPGRRGRRFGGGGQGRRPHPERLRLSLCVRHAPGGGRSSDLRPHRVARLRRGWSHDRNP